MHSFTTERLLIRPLAEQDETFFCQQFTNEKVMRHTGGTLSPEEAYKVFHRSLRANERAIAGGKKSVLTWAILCLNTENIIGTQTLSFLVRPHNADIIKQAEISGIQQTEIGIMLSPQANGKLFPEEAIGALMEYAFSQLGFNRISAFYNNRNLATKRIVNKLGFSPTQVISVNSENDKEVKNTSYQYFDRSNWLQTLITKVFPATS
jgi:RimJ/RimL family protein N-acetyltransferase